MEILTGKYIKSWAAKSVPAKNYTLIGVKFKKNRIMPVLDANLSHDTGEHSPVWMVFNYGAKIVNHKKIEFEDSLQPFKLFFPDVAVPLSYLFADSSNLEQAMLSLMNLRAKIMIERISDYDETEEKRVQIVLTIGEFVTVATCPISTLSSFLEIEPETEE